MCALSSWDDLESKCTGAPILGAVDGPVVVMVRHTVRYPLFVPGTATVPAVSDVRQAGHIEMASHAPPDASLDEASDDELVKRARAGDRPAYGELVRRHQGAALRLAAGVCGSTEEARDIVQEALVKGYRSLDRYRGDAPVRAWLLRIVANDAKNAVRTKVRRLDREGRYDVLDRVLTTATDADVVGDHVATQDETARMLRLLTLLDHRDREILACRFVAGLSERDTATTLAIPLGTVKSRAARALERARGLLREAGDG
jgi:RNA polymerase sigma factor (sigma-70 family)